MLKFLVFADLHYKKGMYAAGVEHLQAILDRAVAEGVDFVIHMGDLCNDYKGSPELLNAYLQNNHGLAVYGIYGNHELESRGNTMEVVTPLLNNRPVTFGGSDVGYWYTDIKGYRLIGLDTNYSYCEATGQWEHNREASWGAPDGNIKKDSLSPRQLAWLEDVLEEGVKANKKILLFSHAAFSGVMYPAPDAENVLELFGKYKGSVIMALNGHYHTDHFTLHDGVAYFDVNTVQNGYWAVNHEHHYEDHHTYSFTDYDGDGKPLGTQLRPLNTLTQGKNTWFFVEPLSAIVTIGEDGAITIEGSQTHWMHDIAPDAYKGKEVPGITSQNLQV